MDDKKDNDIYVTKKEFYGGVTDIMFMIIWACFLLLQESKEYQKGYFIIPFLMFCKYSFYAYREYKKLKGDLK